MYKIDTQYSKNGMFVDGQGTTPGTDWNATWLNSMQEEICYFIESQRITLTKNNTSQFWTALERLIQTKINSLEYGLTSFATRTGDVIAVPNDIGLNRVENISDINLFNGTKLTGEPTVSTVPNSQKINEVCNITYINNNYAPKITILPFKDITSNSLIASADYKLHYIKGVDIAFQYRVKETTIWNSSEHIFVYEDGNITKLIENLQPDKLYEVRVASKYNLKNYYSDIVEVKTLINKKSKKKSS